MDLQKFTTMVRDSRRTQKELEQILHNALQKNANEHAVVVKEQLDLRFPKWQKPRSRVGGNTPTYAMYRKKIRRFETATEAFVWLVEEIVQSHPGIFEKLEATNPWSMEGHSRRWFARSPEQLYYCSRHLAANSALFRKLSNGWFVDVNSNNEHKWSVLFNLWCAIYGDVCSIDFVFVPGHV